MTELSHRRMQILACLGRYGGFETHLIPSRIECSKQQVFNELRKLRAMGMVDYQPGMRPVLLTDEGRRQLWPHGAPSRA